MVSAQDLGGMLFSIHSHHPVNKKIIYYEVDLLKLFKAIGLPEPEWGSVVFIDEYKATE